MRKILLEEIFQLQTHNFWLKKICTQTVWIRKYERIYNPLYGWKVRRWLEGKINRENPFAEWEYVDECFHLVHMK